MDGLMTRGRLHFGNSKEPFALTVAGRRLYIVTSPRDVVATYKSTATLTFDKYIRDMMVAIGVSSSGLEKWWRVQAASGSRGLTGNVHMTYKTPAHVGESFVKHHLNTGKQLDVFQGQLLQRIKDHLSYKISAGQSSTAAILGQVDEKLSLLCWCRHVLLDSATRTFFGDELLQLDPSIITTFGKFDDLNWQFILKYPTLLSREMTTARNKVIGSLTKYVQQKQEDRPGTSTLILALENEMKAQGLDEKDIASLLMLTFWAYVTLPFAVTEVQRDPFLKPVSACSRLHHSVNSNSYKLCFWMMAYIIHESGLADTLREETHSAATSEPQDLVTALDACPRLDAVFCEVLRLVTSSTSVRTVNSPTTIGGKLLLPGNDIFIPYRQMHLDPAAFGSDTHRFNSTRFLDERLKRSPSYRPFGGGTTYCPGRFLAKREVLAFVVLALNRFDLVMDGKETRFPILETRKPSLGILAPVAGDDIFIHLERRDDCKS